MPRPSPLSRLSPELLSPATISFRLDDPSSRVLAERATRLGVSPHELARHYVLEILQQAEERAALREAVVALHKEITGFREDIALATEALLASAGKVTDQEAHAWVEEHFP